MPTLELLSDFLNSLFFEGVNSSFKVKRTESSSSYFSAAFILGIKSSLSFNREKPIADLGV